MNDIKSFTLMKNSIFGIFGLIIILSFYSCATGYTNEYGVYKPKTPNYSLEKKEFVVPPNLDTLNIYVSAVVNPNFVTSDSDLNTPNYEIYHKFFGDGSCIGFAKPIADSLTKKHLALERCVPCYYTFDTKKNLIKIEVFVYGDGTPRYLTSHNILRDNGNILLKYFKNENDTITYTRKILPEKLK